MNTTDQITYRAARLGTPKETVKQLIGYLDDSEYESITKPCYMWLEDLFPQVTGLDSLDDDILEDRLSEVSLGSLWDSREELFYTLKVYLWENEVFAYTVTEGTGEDRTDEWVVVCNEEHYRTVFSLALTWANPIEKHLNYVDEIVEIY